MGILEEVTKLYNQSPYPPVHWLSPFIQYIRSDDLPLLNYRAAFAASFGSVEHAAKAPKILIVGCGTLEPVAVALANPQAQILAVDLSSASMKKLKWMARWKGVASQIQTWVGDLEKIPEEKGKFDYLIATGVLHHLENPERALQKLIEKTHEKTVFRIMYYSRWGRDLLYGAKDMARMLGIRNPKKFRSFMDSLPADHPYRIYFHLYEDARSDGGLADGYLHPCDRPLDAFALRNLLNLAGLEASLFLHHPEGQPEAADRWGAEVKNLDAWQKLALLELYGEMNENFIFFARRKESVSSKNHTFYEWNEALPLKGELKSKLLGENLKFDRSVSPQKAENIPQLVKALFLIPGVPTV